MEGVHKSGPVNSVVTGIIRDDTEFRAIFDLLFEARKKGVIDRIIFSTWKVVAKNKPEAIRWCQKNNVDVVVSTIPEHAMNGNTWLQHKALLMGLELLDLETPVLKTRTDSALGTTKQILNEYCKVGLVQSTGKILKHKILVNRASVTMPFYMVDYAFLGLGSDVRQLVHFDGYFDTLAVPHTITAEMRMFSLPFVKGWRFVDEYYRTVHSRNMSTWMTNHDPSTLPSYILAFFALKFRLLQENFHLQIDTALAPESTAYGSIWEPTPNGLSVQSELFQCSHLSIISNRTLEKLADLDFNNDLVLERTVDALAEVNNLDPAESLINKFPVSDLLNIDKDASDQKLCIRIDGTQLHQDYGTQEKSGLFQQTNTLMTRNVF